MIRKHVHMLLSVLITAEFLLSGLGFCGHTHTHVHPGSDTASVSLQQQEGDCAGLPHSHSSRRSDAKDGKEQNECCRSHCFCLGQVAAETLFFSRYMYLSSSILLPLPAECYDFIFKTTVFRPPIAA